MPYGWPGKPGIPYIAKYLNEHDDAANFVHVYLLKTEAKQH